MGGIIEFNEIVTKFVKLERLTPLTCNDLHIIFKEIEGNVACEALELEEVFSLIKIIACRGHSSRQTIRIISDFIRVISVPLKEK